MVFVRKVCDSMTNSIFFLEKSPPFTSFVYCFTCWNHSSIWTCLFKWDCTSEEDINLTVVPSLQNLSKYVDPTLEHNKYLQNNFQCWKKNPPLAVILILAILSKQIKLNSTTYLKKVPGLSSTKYFCWIFCCFIYPWMSRLHLVWHLGRPICSQSQMKHRNFSSKLGARALSGPL